MTKVFNQDIQYKIKKTRRENKILLKKALFIIFFVIVTVYLDSITLLFLYIEDCPVDIQ